ncbi:cation transporter [Terrisporobacter mayombei]|uniref:Cadmium, zinc and cobalt-transporting ATPase n=1 Tax=Terrisporobacter mayombei TaxID=1541 RepID=A0ABY9Q4R2_9FIRM|nr:cation transporter [Terrisporobacter mayombei]WMT82986.1 Cadmium, zinc and cobalt-transporting ATPase [Terrisporobacter mayombei]
MIKKFRLEGLDCANCASKIENAIRKVEIIDSVTVDFMAAKLVIEAEESEIEEAIEISKGIIKKLEPEIVVKKR